MCENFTFSRQYDHGLTRHRTTGPGSRTFEENWLETIVKKLLFLLALLISGWVLADFPEKAGIYLVDSAQQETRIGDVMFSEASDKDVAIRVSIDTDVFTDHFLSMRPFRCIEGDSEWFCYLEYPYDLRSTITKEDLSDLEYQLLFIRKTPSEFGIDAWNGLYYKLAIEADDTITGRLLEGDLNSLQSPPSEKYAKPVDLEEFIPGDKNRRLFPTLRIY